MGFNWAFKGLIYDTNWQKESWQTFEETSGYVRRERVNKWPNSMTDIWWWWQIFPNLSPALFNIHIDDLLRNWKHKVDAGIMLKRNLWLKTLLFTDDQVIIQDSEDKLQKSVYILNQTGKDYNLKISTVKTKIMAFKGKYLVLSKI